ncbi:hypothetical protein CDD80_880 [Ophiocordyceps camponoti-rufipedis]|uniref:Uncharacterized protein n=1 Tax=Ophiocordyceps camponoti-rufipedis TaxID=2004952 RepID=A0A2C5ZBI2_9HYPO|nr:hypothetical protein CDD80_880 [Ophiocordyceps camponoti-rufipedis]
MFGSFSSLANLPSHNKVDPKDIPPPTPVNLPRYQPYADEHQTLRPSESLTALLEQNGRATSILGPLGLSALGLDLKLDVSIQDLVPDLTHVPDFAAWNRLTIDEACEQDTTNRRWLRTSSLAPGCQVYVERKRELSNNNEDAFRTVRRIPPPRGKQQARLGNAYEFYRCLELFTTYWDDPTQPAGLPPSPELAATELPAVTTDSTATTEAASKQGTEGPKCMGPGDAAAPAVVRVSSGQSMPLEYRQNLVTAFIKLVAYDFGCNVSMARVEPRLHFNSASGPRHRKSYTASNCQFIFQSPMSREAARTGIIYGPVAAVSARPTVDFTSPDVETAHSLDLAREVTAALITAQHRAREGRMEQRFGDGQWWTFKPRWGGGSGGPIGREMDKMAVPGDNDARPGDGEAASAPVVKRSRKTMAVYDSYRIVRPPSSTWDSKAKYEAIGRMEGAGFDDVFVISSVFHHVSFLRVRVPDRLLEALDGAPEPDVTRRSWGKVEAWRSPWYDMFDAGQRVSAVQVLWSVMAYQMRLESRSDDSSDGAANA